MRLNNKQRLDAILARISKREMQKARDYALMELRSQEVENITEAWIKGVLLLMLKKNLLKEK